MDMVIGNLPLLQSGGGTGQLVTTFITFGLVFVVFYFLIIRPQNKKQKEARQMLTALKKGDRVVTIGGMRGTIQSVKDDAIVLKVDDNTKIEFNKSAVASVLVSAKPEKTEEAATEAKPEADAGKKE